MSWEDDIDPNLEDDGMNLVILDVETIRDPRWKTDDRNDGERFPNITFHIPVVVTFLAVETGKAKFALREFAPVIVDSDGAEKVGLSEWNERAWLCEALEAFKDVMRRADLLITHGGRHFDLPLLQLHAKRLGIRWQWWEEMRHRFPQYSKPLRHYDLEEQSTDFGAATRPRLDDLAKFFGYPGKGDVCGADVADLWAVDPQRVVDYCLDDVVQTWLVASHWLELDPEMVREATFTALSDRLCWGPDWPKWSAVRAKSGQQDAESGQQAP